MKKVIALFRVLDRWKGHYLLAGLLLLVSSLVRMLEPKVIQLAIDGAVQYAQTGQSAIHTHPDAVLRAFAVLLPTLQPDNIHLVLLCIAGIFVAIATLQAAARFAAGMLSASSTEKAAQHLRNRLFVHIQAMTLAQIDKFPKGEMIQRCTGDIDTVRRFMNDQVSEMLRMAGILIGGFAMMAMMHLTYAFISIALLLPMLWVSYRFFNKEAGMWDTHEQEQDKLTAIIQENLSGMRVVQAFAQEGREWERFSAQNKAKRAIGVRHMDLHTVFWPIADALCSIQMVVSFVAGAYLTLHQSISLGQFAGFFTYSMMVTWPMRQLGQIVSQMGMAAVAVERIQEVLDAEEEDYTEEAESLGYAPLRGEIEFKNVTFTYPHAQEGQQRRAALEGVSFKIAAGEKIALMGGTGAGKSTIIALLLRFYEPDSGEILLDGQPLRAYSKTLLRRRFGVVHQKAFLFSTSLRQNIGYAQPDGEGDWQLQTAHQWDEATFESATRDARVSDFVHKLHAGMETIVGEKGVTLSGGQKQRVTLARTLLSDPDVLVLDDATSAVDTETEFEIQRALLQRVEGKTTLIIAHRLTSVQYADRIIVLDKGRITEIGTQEALLTQQGFYRQVYDIQIGIESELMGGGGA